MGRTDRTLSPVALLAAMALVAQCEWALAVAVGWPMWIAWAAPVALDAYVISAVRTRRDMGPAVLVSAVSVLASHSVYAAPAAWSSGVAGEGHLIWPLAAACSVVPLLVAWRVHHIDQSRRSSSSPVKRSVPVSQPSRPVSPATSPATVPAPLSVGSVPAGGALTSSASGAGGGGLRAVPSQSDGLPRARAIALAREMQAQLGRDVKAGDLVRATKDSPDPISLSTAKRAVADMKEEVAA